MLGGGGGGESCAALKLDLGRSLAIHDGGGGGGERDGKMLHERSAATGWRRESAREVYSIYEAFDAARRLCDCCCDIRREFNFDFDLESVDAAVG